MFKKTKVEQPTYTRYEYRLGKFTLWICYGKQEAIEQGIADKLYISIFHTNKRRRYQKGFTLKK